MMNGFTNDLLIVIGISLGIVICLRCLFLAIYPLFCYQPRKISTTETTEIPNTLVTPDMNLQIKNVPIVDAKYNDTEEDTLYDVPIATIV